ncbi:MAG: hypothetical protein HY332_02635 [Chloroflexi bacterium]|nr:hypothetical protein [Chloroflexota bacterium]
MAASTTALAISVPTDVQEIVANGLAATGARLVVLGMYEPGRARLRPVAWGGLHAPYVQQAIALARRIAPAFDPTLIALPPDANPLQRAVNVDGRPVAATLLAFAAGIVDRRLLRVAVAVMRTRYVLALPVRVAGEVAGVLSFYGPRPIHGRQERACVAFTRQVALTLENAHLAAALQRQVAALQWSQRLLTQADERLRRQVAELLHGRVQSRLLLAWHRLGQAEALVDVDPAQARALVAAVREELEQIQDQEVRVASHLLHPQIIRVGLGPAVRSLAGRFQTHFRVDVAIDPHLAALDDPAHNRLPEPLRLAAYRAVEEALGNSVRHARARAVVVSLALDGDGSDRRLAVRVRDDGRGCAPERVQVGLGLSSVAGRVEQLGGTRQLTSAPGQGTTLTVRLPLPEAPRRPWAPTTDDRPCGTLRAGASSGSAPALSAAVSAALSSAEGMSGQTIAPGEADDRSW